MRPRCCLPGWRWPRRPRWRRADGAPWRRGRIDHDAGSIGCWAVVTNVHHQTVRRTGFQHVVAGRYKSSHRWGRTGAGAGVGARGAGAGAVQACCCSCPSHAATRQGRRHAGGSCDAVFVVHGLHGVVRGCWFGGLCARRGCAKPRNLGFGWKNRPCCRDHVRLARRYDASAMPSAHSALRPLPRCWRPCCWLAGHAGCATR